MSSQDAWIESIRNLFPDYDQMKADMEYPSFSAVLEQQRNEWAVSIDRKNRDIFYLLPDEGIKARVDWAVKTLLSWKFVDRTDYNRWLFLNKNQAEKFITLYNLRWST